MHATTTDAASSDGRGSTSKGSFAHSKAAKTIKKPVKTPAMITHARVRLTRSIGREAQARVKSLICNVGSHVAYTAVVAVAWAQSCPLSAWSYPPGPPRRRGPSSRWSTAGTCASHPPPRSVPAGPTQAVGPRTSNSGCNVQGGSGAGQCESVTVCVPYNISWRLRVLASQLRHLASTAPQTLSRVS